MKRLTTEWWPEQNKVRTYRTHTNTLFSEPSRHPPVDSLIWDQRDFERLAYGSRNDRIGTPDFSKSSLMLVPIVFE